MQSLSKLQNMDPRIIYLILLLLVSIPLLSPLGIPLSINEMTRTVYNLVDDLEAGDRVLMAINYNPSDTADIEPQAVAVLKHLLQKDVRVAMVSFAASGPLIAEQLLQPYVQAGKTYGSDMINLGFIPGGETAIRSIGSDVVGTAKVDYQGKDLLQAPLLAGVHDCRDFDLVYVLSGYTPGLPEWVQQVQGPLNVRLVGTSTTVSVPSCMPFVQSGQIAGLTSGLRGAAEYELLLQEPGLAVTMMDAQSLGHLTIILFVVIGNIAYFVGKKSVKQ